MSSRIRRNVLRELRSQYRGMLRLKVNTPESYSICELLRRHIREIEYFW